MTVKTSVRELKESNLKALLLDRVGNEDLKEDAFAAAMKLAMGYDDVDDLQLIADNAAYYYDGYVAALKASS